MTEVPVRVFPKPQNEFLLVLLVVATCSVITASLVLDQDEAGQGSRDPFAILATIVLVVITLLVARRVLRPGPYLTLDQHGLTRFGPLGTCGCNWRDIHEIGYANLQFGLGPKLGVIGADAGARFGACTVFAPWMRVRPDEALALITRYWRHAKFGEPFEVPG